MSRPLPPQRPLAIAHRAGNDVRLLREAERLRLDIIEADVWSYRSRLEVRHLKTMGRLPVLWDRWKLASGWGPRLGLVDLLEAAARESELMLDLKGTVASLPDAVMEALQVRPGVGVTVCSQSWTLLKPFEALQQATVIYSIGNRRQLQELLARPPSADGFSIHRRLLNAPVVASLKQIAPAVITWPVASEAEAHTLAAIGVDGVISTNLPMLGRLVAEREGKRPE
ncbi:MAG TPA: glycerophosphodiester phosphodiesterase [Dehalococcoidia bacterium]|nr:glycerophosphodiester phosphodiesterase [Dehalococcoidia bacterium]